MSDGKIIQENGENIIPITHETCVLDDEGNPITETIGDVSLLNTESKNLVGAINEVFGDTIKEQIVNSLVNNGIDVNINDSWSIILGKLNEGVSSGGLDIFSATELPTTGKDGQICILMDDPINNFVITTNQNLINESQVILYNDMKEAYNYTHTIDDTTYTFNFYKVCCNNVTYNSYYWKNNMWNELTNANFYLFKKGEGALVAMSDRDTTNRLGITIGTDSIKLNTYQSQPIYTGIALATDVLIDVGAYNKMYIEYSFTSEHSYTENNYTFRIMDINDTKHASATLEIRNDITPKSGVIELDISKVTSDTDIQLVIDHAQSIKTTFSLTINNIYCR